MQGRFEILSLSGSFTLSENGGARSRTGGLSISLAGPDGRVVGGGVAGLLLAASPIQVSIHLFHLVILVLLPALSIGGNYTILKILLQYKLCQRLGSSFFERMIRFFRV